MMLLSQEKLYRCLPDFAIGGWENLLSVIAWQGDKCNGRGELG